MPTAEQIREWSERYSRDMAALEAVTRRLSERGTPDELAVQRAEEAVREGLTRTLERFARQPNALAEMATYSHFRRYVHQAAINWAVSEYGRRPAAQPLEDVSVSGDEDVIDELEELGHRLSDLRERLAHLAAGDRELVQLKFDEGLTFAEIAAQRGMPLGTLYFHFQRILAALREPAPVPPPPSTHEHQPMSDLAERIRALDPASCARVLSTIAAYRVRSQAAVLLTRDDALVAALGAPPGKPAPDDVLARDCLLLLADEPDVRPVLESMLDNPTGAESFGPTRSTLSVTAAALIVLQGYFQIARGPDLRWSANRIKEPAVVANLDRVIEHLGGGAAAPAPAPRAGAFDRGRVVAALKALPAPAAEAVYAQFGPGARRTPEQWVAWAETDGPGLDEFVVGAHRANPLAGFLQRVRPETPRIDSALLNEPVPDESAIPVLVAVGDAGEALDVAGFTVLSRFGQIVAGVGSRAALRELAARPSVLSVEHSPPIGEPQCAVSVPFVRADVIHTNYAERGDRAVVGIIDNGIDVLHETFLDAPAESPYADDPAPAAVGKPRIIAVWDQRKDVGPPPPAEALRGEPFGTYHSREDIARYVAQKSVERGLTAGLECHGTHVASIAAGRACGGSTGFRGGVAPGARIVVVIPKRAAEPGSPDSIGYSVSHAAALEFIKWAAAREDDKPPVVVNLSLGAQVGAHDGTSLLESMFDTFSGGGRVPGAVVVKSAGNDGKFDLHAVVPLNAGMTERLAWYSPLRDEDDCPNGRRLDLIDCWFPSFDPLRFRLIDPQMQESPEVSVSVPVVTWTTGFGNACELRYEQFYRDNGASRLLIRVRGTGAVPIQPGKWQLKITAGALRRPDELHAWIDRISDLRPAGFLSHAERKGTLSVPGTAQTVIAVGAVGAAESIEVPAFASWGKTRDGREKPEVSAPGVDVCAAASRTGTGVRPESGTSMAAPHVTGAIALLLSHAAKQGRVLNANQIGGALRASTRSGNAGWHPGAGYGAIDVAALFRALGFPPPPPAPAPAPAPAPVPAPPPAPAPAPAPAPPPPPAPAPTT